MSCASGPLIPALRNPPYIERRSIGSGASSVGRIQSPQGCKECHHLPNGHAGACLPWGLKARALLRRSGYAVEDHHLATREETDAFKAAQKVPTTPQVFIGGQRIGGYDDLRRFLGKRVPDPKQTLAEPSQ